MKQHTYNQAVPNPLLAYHESLIASHKALSADAYHVQELPKAEEARDITNDLIEALRPFAHPDLSEVLHGGAVRDDQPIYGRNTAILRLGDFRKARAALERAGVVL